MILAFDTSTPTGDLALVAPGGEVVHHTSFPAQRSHNSALFPALQEPLAQGAPTAVVVGTGPGSYTGCRIGIAAAQALGLAYRIPVHGVPSVCAIAGAPGDYAVCGDARRGTYFYAEIRAGALATAPELGTLDDLSARLGRAGLPAFTLDQTAPACGFPVVSVAPDATVLASKTGGGAPAAPVPVYLAAPFVTTPNQSAPHR